MSNYDYTTIPGAEDFAENLDTLVKQSGLKKAVVASILNDYLWEIQPKRKPKPVDPAKMDAIGKKIGEAKQ